MQRRNFIKAGMIGIVGTAIGCSVNRTPRAPGVKTWDRSITYLLPDSIKATDITIPANMRVPFQWSWFGLNEEPVIINFKRLPGQKMMPARFRISTAIDVREEKLVEVSLPLSKRVLGIIDIRYSPIFQPFELPISGEDLDLVFREGIQLRQTKGLVPLWLFKAGGPDVENKALLTHLLFIDKALDPMDAFLGSFLSLNVIQTFGWMEGCVLDGMLDLHRRYPEKKVMSAIDLHLRQFFDNKQNLFYEGPFSRPYLNEFYNIEALLPFAAIAQISPNHPVLPKVAAYCINKANTAGLIRDKQLTTEGCYTIAYPLAAVAVALNDKKLALLAVTQLLLRKELLVKDGVVHQKLDEHNKLSFGNWARGVSWYLLGIVRTLSIIEQNETLFEEFREEVSVLKTEFARAANQAAGLQHDSGLWFCFLDRPLTELDSSGSAGIAAALAIGAARVYLSNNITLATTRARDALLRRLTPDGFLTGSAQANKGGLALQESGYRVISQYSSGLMAQLIAAG